VAPNPWSLAQALAEPAIAWPRAIVAGSEVVGFLMLEIDPHDPHGRPFWLWRLMIGAAHQRQGMGTAALAAAVDEVRARGGTELYTSWVPGQGGPEPFYRHLGFHPTGEIDDGETVARLALQPPGVGSRPRLKLRSAMPSRGWLTTAGAVRLASRGPTAPM
jgi:diamine N-acetyltransferase